jgi:hypothetical protein
LRSAKIALSTFDQTFGSIHDLTKECAHVIADALAALGRADKAAALRERCGIASEGGKKE